LFSYISKNWRGTPLLSLEVIVSLIANTVTSKGLQVRASPDEGFYGKGIKISDEELAKVHIQRDSFRGEWNYTISP
jgi:hypothetical protein